MLRVGLTGELGSGKSTVARLLADHGAIVFSSDEIGRAMMQPGQAVYKAIVEHFGPAVLLPDGQLNRPELARLAFDPEHPRVEELNAIVHPAVIGEQERLISELAISQPDAIVVVESALIFSTNHTGANAPWRKRFDRIVLVNAPDEVKVERFIQRAANGRQLDVAEREALRNDGLARLSKQRMSETADFVLANDSGMDELTRKVNAVWTELKKLETPRLNSQS